MHTEKTSRSVSKRLISIGIWLLLCGVVLAFFVFFPVLREEWRYRFVTGRHDAAVRPVTFSPDVSESIVPVNDDFAIVIPKIGANAPVIADVDPFDATIYRRALRDGVAHATGSGYPGEPGNTFLFAHSSDDFLTGGRYNSIFYLIGKLEKGDRFFLAYRGALYVYRVFDTRTVAAEDVEYLHALSEEHTVTLMTCWPPGTDARRLLVFGVSETVTSEKNFP